MNPGTLDRKIQIQRQAPGLPVVDSLGAPMLDSQGNAMYTSSRKSRFGEELNVWGLWRERMANLKALSGSEGSDNGREIGTQRVRFRIRYTVGLTLVDRIYCDGHAYDIVNIAEIERRKLQDLECVLHANTRPDGS